MEMQPKPPGSLIRGTSFTVSFVSTIAMMGALTLGKQELEHFASWHDGYEWAESPGLAVVLLLGFGLSAFVGNRLHSLIERGLLAARDGLGTTSRKVKATAVRTGELLRGGVDVSVRVRIGQLGMEPRMDGGIDAAPHLPPEDTGSRANAADDASSEHVK